MASSFNSSNNIQGSVTTIESNNLIISDPLIKLNKSDAAVDSGVIFGNTTRKALIWDQSASAFVICDTTSSASDSTVTVGTKQALHTGNLSVGNVIPSITSNFYLGGVSNFWAGAYLNQLQMAGTITAYNIGFGADSTYAIGSPTIRPANIYSDSVTSGNVTAAASTISSTDDVILDAATGSSVLSKVNGGTVLTTASTYVRSEKVITVGSTPTSGSLNAAYYASLDANGNALVEFYNTDTTGGNGIYFQTSTTVADDNVQGGTSLYYFKAANPTGATTTVTIWSDGDADFDNVYSSSDLKLKENVVAASGKLEDLMSLEVKSFNYIKGKTNKRIGLIAQDVQAIWPSLVVTHEERSGADANGPVVDSWLKIKETPFMYMIMKGLQEHVTETRSNVNLSSTNAVMPVAPSVIDLGSPTIPYNDIYCMSTVQLSDKRFKKNIQKSLGLNWLKKLNPVQYQYKSGGIRLHQGFLADELDGNEFGGKVTDKNGVQGIRMTEIIAPLVAAVKELSDRLERLESRPVAPTPPRMSRQNSSVSLSPRDRITSGSQGRSDTHDFIRMQTELEKKDQQIKLLMSKMANVEQFIYQ